MGKYSSDEENSDDGERTRVYIGEINSEISRTDLEKAFKKFGPLFEVWLARYPPLFAFVVFQRKKDAEDAVREMNGETMRGARLQVNLARPRNRSRGGFSRSTFRDPDIRCYQCQERGHIARHCTRFTSGYRRHFSRSRSRSRSPRRRSRRSSSGERTRKRSQSHSRSRSRDRERRRSRTEQGAS
ncbi:serine/arginine-rich splicing factor 7-like [Acanthaster planci]|uniref:Serine/arginine-rich splicing factor 7-like n=1 Tax=Acanthaster planci TaxID=133434 RepID=A0A8B7XRZ1_ACAPL|nr:serine/arginine-rich splicing factor 7-like [Acanthaster planci]